MEHEEARGRGRPTTITGLRIGLYAFALLGGMSYREAGRELKVQPRQVARWRQADSRVDALLALAHLAGDAPPSPVKGELTPEQSEVFGLAIGAMHSDERFERALDEAQRIFDRRYRLGGRR